MAYRIKGDLSVANDVRLDGAIIPGSLTTAERTAKAAFMLVGGDKGARVFDTDEGLEYIWDGAAWASTLVEGDPMDKAFGTSTAGIELSSMQPNTPLDLGLADWVFTDANALIDAVGDRLVVKRAGDYHSWWSLTGDNPLVDPSIGAAETFAVLGGASVTAALTGTVINGDVGTAPGVAITGFPASATVTAPYAIHTNDAEAIAAVSDAAQLYDTLQGMGGATTLAAEMSGITLTPGVYTFAATANLAAAGTLTLDGPGDYVFQVVSTLTTAATSNVVLANGATADQVFWQCGTTVSLSGTSFSGTVLAGSTALLSAGSSMDGRLFAASAAGTVTLAGSNTITVPDPRASGMQVLVNSVVVAYAGTEDSVGANSDHFRRVDWYGSLLVGDVVEFEINSVWGGSIRSSQFALIQLPSSDLVIPGATVVDDQVASGYMDIGTMRMQWGVDSSALAGTRVVTLPALFADTNYTVTATVDRISGTGLATVGTLTTSTFSTRPATGSGTLLTEDIHWIAIGLKP
jgi:hypothetical protein